MREEAPARAEVPAADDAAARVEAVVAADDPPRGDVPSRAGLRGSAVPGPVARSVAAPHPPAEPVRVTIGRIEVHAPVPALPEAPAPDWTPPFMSLDDYLARR
jgi:hypothetical protein